MHRSQPKPKIVFTRLHELVCRSGQSFPPQSRSLQGSLEGSRQKRSQVDDARSKTPSRHTLLSKTKSRTIEMYIEEKENRQIMQAIDHIYTEIENHFAKSKSTFLKSLSDTSNYLKKTKELQCTANLIKQTIQGYLIKSQNKPTFHTQDENINQLAQKNARSRANQRKKCLVSRKKTVCDPVWEDTPRFATGM